MKSLLKGMLAKAELFDNISEQSYIVSEKENGAAEQEDFAVTAER